MILELIIALVVGVLIGTITGFHISKPRAKIKNFNFTDMIPYENCIEL